MNDDVLFRNSIYGFNKEDVLNYIEEIKKENENQKKLAIKSVAELSSAFKSIDELEKQILYKSQIVDDELNLESRQYKSKMTKGTQNIPVKISTQSINTVDYIDDVESLKSENRKLKAALKHFRGECERFKNMEKQFGSMLLDAYIYSGNILDDAREKAEQITKSTKNTIEQATGDMGDFSSYVNNISIGFSQIVSELTYDIKNITENLISGSQSFQYKTNDKNKEVKVSDVNNYINNSQKQENYNKLNDDNSLLFEKVSSFDEYIEIFENLTNEYHDEIENIEQYPHEGISYAVHSVNELIGEYFQFEDEKCNNNNNGQFGDMINEYVSSSIEKKIENEEIESEEQEQIINSTIVDSKRVDIETDESIMFNMNERYKIDEKMHSKSRIVRVKLKIKKDK